MLLVSGLKCGKLQEIVSSRFRVLPAVKKSIDDVCAVLFTGDDVWSKELYGGRWFEFYDVERACERLKESLDEAEELARKLTRIDEVTLIVVTPTPFIVGELWFPHGIRSIQPKSIYLRRGKLEELDEHSNIVCLHALVAMGYHFILSYVPVCEVILTQLHARESHVKQLLPDVDIKTLNSEWVVVSISNDKYRNEVNCSIFRSGE